MDDSLLLDLDNWLTGTPNRALADAGDTIALLQRCRKEIKHLRAQLFMSDAEFEAWHDKLVGEGKAKSPPLDSSH